MKTTLTIFTTIFFICLLGLIGLIITYIWFDWTDIMSKLLKTFIFLGFISIMIVGITYSGDYDPY